MLVTRIHTQTGRRRGGRQGNQATSVLRDHRLGGALQQAGGSSALAGCDDVKRTRLWRHSCMYCVCGCIGCNSIGVVKCIFSLSFEHSVACFGVLRNGTSFYIQKISKRTKTAVFGCFLTVVVQHPIEWRHGVCLAASATAARNPLLYCSCTHHVHRVLSMLYSHVHLNRLLNDYLTHLWHRTFPSALYNARVHLFMTLVLWKHL